jgi:hypothetical protein
VGIVLVTASVVVGARTMASADDSVRVWALARDATAGETLDADDLVATRVRFIDAGTERYLAVGEPLPDELHVERALGEGELLPAAALGEPAAEEHLRISLALPTEEVPTGVGRGAEVDVWVVGDGARGRSRATMVLPAAVVLDVPREAESFVGASGRRQLVLGVPEARSAALGVVLGASGSGGVRIVARG